MVMVFPFASNAPIVGYFREGERQPRSQEMSVALVKANAGSRIYKKNGENVGESRGMYVVLGRERVTTSTVISVVGNFNQTRTQTRGSQNRKVGKHCKENRATT